jgi:hypothetical protein
MFLFILQKLRTRMAKNTALIMKNAKPVQDGHTEHWNIDPWGQDFESRAEPPILVDRELSIMFRIHWISCQASTKTGSSMTDTAASEFAYIPLLPRTTQTIKLRTLY